ncbi:hypothetical protein BDP27DRAFT_1402540 [Rhodocollybia butyracea]|uniref:Uncharacterized protein n=1 Tax=Rhodocollybia butyracea TaxID=206335 RepID=A0A9P5U920_9AGAR|nr:hypothetical protein BDP27DRAFT_1402540 [Rhodocollybia butyracea]
MSAGTRNIGKRPTAYILRAIGPSKDQWGIPVGSNVVVKKWARVDRNNNTESLTCISTLVKDDEFIMTSSIPHVVLTIESSICEGSHFFFTQRLSEMAFGIFHTFAASGLLTNTTHSDVLQSLQKMVVSWAESLNRYKEDLKEAQKTKAKDVIGLLMITNIVTFGSILDSRRYLDPTHLTDANLLYHSSLSQSDLASYLFGKTAAAKLLDRVYGEYHLVLVKDGVIQTENQTEDLRSYRNAFLIQQTKALVFEIKEARADNIEGENKWVSVVKVREAMEENLLDDDEVKALWPSKAEWNELLADGFTPTPTYSFPPPPDTSYKVTTYWNVPRICKINVSTGRRCEKQNQRT